MNPTPADAQDLEFNTDHFWCAMMQYVEAGVVVRLGDQFDNQPDEYPGPKSSQVLDPVRFCSPVRKVVEATGAVTPITKPKSFLTLYEIFEFGRRRLTPTRKVVIQNQFGKKTITAFGPELLGVPTVLHGDDLPGAKADVNHYKCYRAYGPSANKLVTLADRYTSQAGVKVTFPFSFCNPTEKTHDDVVSPVLYPEDHLVCYLVSRRPSPGEGLLSDDQFGGAIVAREGTDLLCVPTKKLKVTVVK